MVIFVSSQLTTFMKPLYSTSSHFVEPLDPTETHHGDLLCPEAELRSSASGKLD